MRTRVNRRLMSALSELQKEQRLSLDRKGDHTPETWFIGPKGENAELFQRLVTRAIDHHMAFRRDYMPNDPPIRHDRESRAIQKSEAFIAARLDEMLDYLRGSVPLASFRNMSHMYWDQALPAVLGYIAALLYNQNNVAAEASPATTLLEIEVGNDLCRMLGYPRPTTEEIARGAIKPVGPHHLRRVGGQWGKCLGIAEHQILRRRHGRSHPRRTRYGPCPQHHGEAAGWAPRQAARS